MSDFVVVSMKAKGSPANIDIFLSYLNNRTWLYDAEGTYIGIPEKHFSGISSEMSVNAEKKVDGDIVFAYISFACVWSMDCLIEKKYADTPEKKAHTTTLEECCRELGLEVEAFSEGNDFDEYYKCVKNGDTFDILFGTEDVEEIYLNDFEPDDLQKINGKFGTSYTFKDIVHMCADEGSCRISRYDWEFTI